MTDHRTIHARAIRENDAAADELHDTGALAEVLDTYERFSRGLVPWSMSAMGLICLWGAISFRDGALLLLSVVCGGLAAVVDRMER